MLVKNSLENEIAKMRSLMERVEKPHTASQAFLNEQTYLNEGVERMVQSPEKVFDILNDIGKNNFVSVGIVTGANLKIPQVKKKNPETNKLKNYDDWEKFGQEIGSKEEIAALVGISSYNFRYYPNEEIKKQYGKYKSNVNDIRAKYGLEPMQDKENDYKEKMGYGKGIDVYNGDDETKQGNFYVAFNAYNVKPRSVVYVVNNEGHIVQELTQEQVIPYLKEKDPYAGISGVSALKKMGKEEEEIENFVNDIKALKFFYKNFEGNSILWIAATVNKQKIIYINDNLKKSVSGIDVNPEDFIAKAKERYNVDIQNMPEA